MTLPVWLYSIIAFSFMLVNYILYLLKVNISFILHEPLDVFPVE